MWRSSILPHTVSVRITTLWVATVLLAGGVAYAQTPPASTPLTLAAAIDRAMAASPAIVAARSRRAVSVAGRAMAGERLNPEGRAEFDRDAPRQAYTLAVPWELGGKRDRRIDVANATLASTQAEIEQVIAQTRNDVRRSYFDLAIANARVVLIDDLQGLAVRIRDAAQQRFDAGSVPRLEVLQAELALAQTQNEGTGARGEVVAAKAQLNALIGVALDAPTLLAPTDFDVSIGFDAAMTRARATSVELALIDRRIEEQRSRIALAQAMQTPDITPEAGVTHGFGEDSTFQTGWKAAIALSIPLFTTHKAGVALEQAALSQLMAEREATLSRISGDVASATAVASAQRERYLRYRDQIIPQALQVEQMADDAYRLGQTGIAAYLQALQSTRDARLRSLQSEADLYNALSDLERAIGAPLLP